MLFRYLIQAILLRAVVALPTLCLIYLGVSIGDQGRQLAGEVGWGVATQVWLLRLPMILVQLTPVALLLGTVLALTSLRNRGELDAVACLGASPTRLFGPILVAGLLFGLLSAVVGEVLVPRCEQTADAVMARRGHRSASPLTGRVPHAMWLRHGSWFYRLSGQHLVALEIGPEFAPIRRVDQTPTRTIDTKVKGNTLVRRTRSHRFEGLPGVGRLSKTRTRAEALGTTTLHRRLVVLEGAGQRHTAGWLVFHSKLAFPLLNIVVALFACLFATGHRPRTPVRDMAWATTVVLGLWLAVALGWVLSRAGWIGPGAGVWGPVCGAGLVAAGLLWYRARPTRPPNGAPC